MVNGGEGYFSSGNRGRPKGAGKSISPQIVWHTYPAVWSSLAAKSRTKTWSPTLYVQRLCLFRDRRKGRPYHNEGVDLEVGKMQMNIGLIEHLDESGHQIPPALGKSCADQLFQNGVCLQGAVDRNQHSLFYWRLVSMSIAKTEIKGKWDVL